MSDDEARQLSGTMGAKLLDAINNQLLPFYLSKGCPCAFPRFRALVEFSERVAKLGAVGSHEGLTLVQQTLLNKGSCYESICEEQVRCTVCGSEFLVHYEDYSVSFYLFHVRCTKELAKPIGAIATKPFPLVFGLYALKGEVLEKIDLFEPTGFDESGIERFTRYMMTLPG